MNNKNEQPQDLKIKFEKKPNCEIFLELEVPKELVKKAKIEAIKDIKKEVTLPGFRKGKAPNNLIEKKYPLDIENKWEKKIADLSFVEAFEKEKLPTLTHNSKIIFKIDQYSLEDGAKLSYTYETEPEVPKVDPKDIKLNLKEPKKITQKEIDEIIHQMRFFHATWNDVDRPIEENDYILIDLDSLETDPSTRVFNDTRFEVSNKGMANWMKELVIGKTTGDEIEGISKPDDHLSEKEKESFEPKKVLVTIKKVESATLPEVTDEFAKKVGSKNVEEMKKDITKMLEERLREAEDQENRHLANEFLIKNYKFDLPKSLVESEVKYKKAMFFKNPKNKAQFDKFSEKEIKDFDKEVLKSAENSLRLFFLSKKILEDNNIEIKNNEILNLASSMLQNATGKKIEPKDISRDLFTQALSRLVLLKAEDFILEHYKKA